MSCVSELKLIQNSIYRLFPAAFGYPLSTYINFAG